MKILKILPYLLLSTAFLAGGLRYGDFYLFHLIGILYVIYLCLNFKNILPIIKPTLVDPVILFFGLYFLYPLIYFIFTRETILLTRFIFNGFGFLILIAGIEIANEGHKGIRKNLIGLGCVYISHLVLSTIESTGKFRWPISSLSKYNQLFNIDFIKLNYFDYGVLASPFAERPTSFYWSINTAAFVTLLGVPFLFLYLKHAVKYILIALAFMVIFASGSRWIVGLLLLSLIASLVVCFYQKQYKQIFKLLSSSLAGVMVFMLLVMTPWHCERMFLGPNFLNSVVTVVESGGHASSTKIKDTEKLDDSVKSRGQMFFECLNLFKQNPIMGLSPGKLSQETSLYKMGVPHFYWLEIMVEYGAVMFLFYLIALWLMFKRVVVGKFSDLNLKYSTIITFLLFGAGVLVLGTANYFLPKWVLYAHMYMFGKIADKETT